MFFPNLKIVANKSIIRSFIQPFALWVHLVCVDRNNSEEQSDTYTISRSQSAQMFCPVGRPPVLALFTGAFTGAFTWWVVVGPKDTFALAWYCCWGLGLNERGSSTHGLMYNARSGVRSYYYLNFNIIAFIRWGCGS